jgi:hypothetical protein
MIRPEDGPTRCNEHQITNDVMRRALSRACRADHERCSLGEARKRLRRPDTRLRRFMNLITLSEMSHRFGFQAGWLGAKRLESPDSACRGASL